MLHIFRKYQRAVFLVITIVVVITFIFFGTYDVVFGPRALQEETTFETLSHRKIPQGNFRALSHFLRKEGLGNPLNEGFIAQEILSKGLAEILFSAYQPLLEGELGERLVREREFVPYRHPAAPELSAEGLWRSYAPALLQGLERVRGGTMTPLEGLTAQVGLYLAERSFSPALLRAMLLYQQRAAAVAADPRLASGSLALFGYRDLADWFGEGFMEVATAFVLNGAALAEESGVEVSYGEARDGLLVQCALVLQRHRAELEGKISTPEELLQCYLNHNGMEERLLVGLWRDLMLFKALFAEEPVEHPPGAFQELVRVGVEVERFAFPFVEEEALGRYLRAVAALSGEEWPTVFYTVEEVAKQHPELVRREYLLAIASVVRGELLARLPVQEIWQWQEAHWEELALRYVELKGEGDHWARLEGLSEGVRAQVNGEAERALLAAHPEWVEETLRSRIPEERRIALHELPGISDVAALERALREGAVVGYTQDGEHYYALTLRGEPESRLLSFQEARGVVTGEGDPLLQARIQHYLEAERNRRITGLSDVATGPWALRRTVERHFEALESLHLEEGWSPVEGAGFCHFLGAVEETSGRDAKLREVEVAHNRERARQLAERVLEGMELPQYGT